MASPESSPEGILHRVNSWSSFSPPPDPDGPVRRLELDLRRAEPAGEEEVSGKKKPKWKGMLSCPRSVWDEVVELLGGEEIDQMVSNGAMDSYLFDVGSLFVFPLRVVLICSMHNQPHKALKRVLGAVAQCGCEVEWASFIRKDHMCPWDNTSTLMGLEYANLKDAFPKGNPLIFGPVDSDHYFYFVYDGIRRAPGVDTNESDMQLNVNMYDISPHVTRALDFTEDHCSDEVTHTVRDKAGLNVLLTGWHFQDQGDTRSYQLNAIRGNEYRAVHIDQVHASVSYETNVTVENYFEHITMLIALFKPARFSLTTLVDPQSAAGLAKKAGKAIGIESEHYEPSYRLANRAMNEFGPGYSVVSTSFIKNDKA